MTIAKFEVPDWIRSVLICDPTDIWGNALGMGLGDLAAILSGARRYDRRGSIFGYYDFGEGFEIWLPAAAGDAITPALSSSAARTGKFSVKLAIDTGGDGVASISTRIPSPFSTRFGFEGSFSFLNGNLNYLEFRVIYYDGTKSYDAALRVKPVSDKVVYVDSAGNEQDLFTSLKFVEYIHVFNTLKMVIDVTAKKWVRVLVNNQSTDLTASLREGSASGARYLSFGINLFGDTVQTTSCYIDDLVFTFNEPA